MELKLKAGQFYGTTSQALSANAFGLLKDYASRARCLLTRMSSHFCFVLAGSYKENIAGKIFERRPTACLLSA